jgi:hypothetical protein
VQGESIQAASVVEGAGKGAATSKVSAGVLEVAGHAQAERFA